MRVNSIGLRLNYTTSWGNRIPTGRCFSRNQSLRVEPFSKYFGSFNRVEGVHRFIVFSKFALSFLPREGSYASSIQIYLPTVEFAAVDAGYPLAKAIVRCRVINLLDYIIQRDLGRMIGLRMKFLNYILVSRYFLDAYIVSDYITKRLAEKFKLSQIVKNFMTDVVEQQSRRGVIVQCSGRFDRNERASSSIFSKGKLSRSTFRNKLSYSCNEVTLQYGICGIKVWILRE